MAGRLTTDRRSFAVSAPRLPDPSDRARLAGDLAALLAGDFGGVAAGDFGGVAGGRFWRRGGGRFWRRESSYVGGRSSACRPAARRIGAELWRFTGTPRR